MISARDSRSRRVSRTVTTTTFHLPNHHLYQNFRVAGLVANPVVTVEVGTEKFRARAAQVHGSERTRLFDATAKLLPLLTEYQNKTKREIPVLTLTRID